MVLPCLRNEPSSGSGRGPALKENVQPAATSAPKKRVLVEALLVIVLACLAGVSWLPYWSMHVGRIAELSETHSRLVIQDLGELLASLNEAETAQRNFIITANPQDLALHHTSLNGVAARMVELRLLTTDRPDTQKALTALLPLMAAKFDTIKDDIALRETQGWQGFNALAKAEPDRHLMGQIRLLMAQAQTKEMQLLKGYALQRQADSRRFAQVLMLASALGGCALVLLFKSLRCELVSRRRAEAARDASEERYGRLFDSIDEGFCIAEQVLDRDGRAVDFICLEANPAFEKHTGISRPIGKPISHLTLAQKADNIEHYAQVVRTGQAVRFVDESKSVERCLDVHACRLGGPESSKVAILVRNITERRNVELALSESQRFLRSALDALSGHIAVLDESGTVLEINAAWQRFADQNACDGGGSGSGSGSGSGRGSGGAAAGIGIGANYLRHCRQSPEEGGSTPDYALAIQDIIAGRRAYFEMEYTCHSPTEQRWFVMRVTRFHSPGPVRVVVVHDDCTRQKLAENALRDSEERYRNLFVSMDEGFCILDMVFNAQGEAVDCCFVEANPAFTLQTGLRGIAGKRLRELAPNHKAGWLKAFGEVALTGKPVRFVYEEKLPDLKFDIYAARLGSAEHPKVAIVFNNITQSARAAEALRQSDQRFRALFDWGPVAMHTCDSSGTILEFNRGAVELWGRKPLPEETDEQFRGSFKFYLPDGTERSYAQTGMAQVLRGEKKAAHNLETIIERPDGLRLTVVGKIVPLKNQAGEIIGTINCFHDITERSRLERQTQDQAQALADLHRRKDEFLAMLSHELRNPLAPLTSAVELLRQRDRQDAAYQQACEVIARQARQMKVLLDDLLDVARITGGSVRLRKERISIGGIVDKALQTAHPLIALRGHQISVSLPTEPVWLDADATRLEQVLVNLLNNAAKYTDEGGRLWLTVVEEPGPDKTVAGAVAVLKVRDTGMGIAAELLPHVFEMFIQAERAIDRSQGGLGIGLCLVRQLVELHGGSVEVQSILGQGSEFTVRLPVSQSAAAPPSLALPADTPARPAARRCRVLAVDDSADAVDFLARLLRLSGHVVEVAYDGHSVLPAARAMRPDVVLLDIGLPGLTGYEVARLLRREPDFEETVLVALTGYGRASDRQRSRSAGFDHHLVKPAGVQEVEDILAVVGEKLDAQAALAALACPLVAGN